VLATFISVLRTNMCLRWLCKRNGIYPLTQDEYPDVCQIFEKTFDVKQFPMTEFKKIWDNRDEETCGYFISNKLVGFSIVGEKKKAKYLHFLAVLPDNQGNGIGTLMLRYILKKVFSIYLWPMNERLKPWYEKQGFYHSHSGYYVFNNYPTRLKRNGRVSYFEGRSR